MFLSPLQDDHLLTNPVIRLHVLDPGTGNYLQNLATPGMLMDPASQAHVRPHAECYHWYHRLQHCYENHWQAGRASYVYVLMQKGLCTCTGNMSGNMYWYKELFNLTHPCVFVVCRCWNLLAGRTW